MFAKASRKAGWTTVLFGIGFTTLALAQTPQAGPPFNLKDRNAGNRWLTEARIDRTLEANVLVGFTGVGAIFRTPTTDTVHQVATSIPRFVFRTEYYGPRALPNGKTSLSRSADYDINCRSKVSRVVAIREYAAHNMSGEAVGVGSAPDAPFTSVEQDAIVKDVYDDICNTNGVSERLGQSDPRASSRLGPGLGEGRVVTDPSGTAPPASGR